MTSLLIKGLKVVLICSLKELYPLIIKIHSFKYLIASKKFKLIKDLFSSFISLSVSLKLGVKD